MPQLKNYLVFLIILCEAVAKAGNPVDSLNKLIATCGQDTNRVILLNEVSPKYDLMADYEKALRSAKEARALSLLLKYDEGLAHALTNISVVLLDKSDYPGALSYLDSALEIELRNHFIVDAATSYMNKGQVYMEIGEIDKALELETKALGLVKDKNVSLKVLTPIYLNLGNTYFKKGNNAKALELYLEALRVCGEDDNKTDVPSIYNNIAGVYIRQSDFVNAELYLLKSLRMRQKKNDKKGISGSYNNLGNMYAMKKDYTLALDYLNKALAIRKELGLKRGMASTLNGIAGVYSELRQFEKADQMDHQALEIYKEIGNKEGMTDIHANLGLMYFQEKQYKKALGQLLLSLQIAQENNLADYIMSAKQNLSECYSKMGDWENALNYYKGYIAERDSQYNRENTKKIVQSQMSYDFDKKEATAKAEQEKKDALAEKDRQKERFIRNTLLAGTALILLFALLIFRSYRQKQRANLLLEEQKKEIAHQKELVDEKNKEILDSIHYAQRIQVAILPAAEEVERIFPQSMVLFIPKDIVSGDFYWITEKEEFIFYVVADCTGHGVPGSFMSMLGTALLNEVINEKKIYEPADILDMLRVKIILALKQKGVSGENKDGMDMCLVRVNKQHTELVYAAANNSLYLVRQGSITDHKGDKQPVGIAGGASTQFTQHTISLQPGDCIFTFTDGFADQFGGPKGKKFKYKQLEDLLAKNTGLSMKEQKEVLETKFNTWKKGYEQVDDVCMIGIRV